MPSTGLALHTDFYEITMSAVYHARGMNQTATFSLFAHDLPTQRGYMVAAGLETALDYLENFAFTQKDIDYLRSLGRFDEDFLKHLADVRFTGDVWALSEGTVCFAEEPILEVTAPIIEAQLVETHLIQTINLHSTMASKAARCVTAAQGRPCIDFSLRRCQGRDAGYAVARSSAMVGFIGTSNVDAARRLGTMPVGTMAHSFIEAFGDEAQAFGAFSEVFPEHTVTLVDTYDTEGGLKHSVEVAKSLIAQGHSLVGIRLDSGDLAALSIKAREILNEAGMQYVKVVVSGSLDEHRIQEMLSKGAKVDLLAVGTKMGSSADAPYLDLAYKLVAYDGQPTLKLSSGKESLVMPKQIWRRLGTDGRIESDLLCLRDEKAEGSAILRPVMQNGRREGQRLSWRDAQDVFKNDYATLPGTCLKLNQPGRVPVQVSSDLKTLQDKTRQATLERQANSL
jgi:nicotinate phosphoribosyltransferase